MTLGHEHHPLAQQFIERARALAGGSLRQRLEALFCADAARWHAWPGDLAEALSLEPELLAATADDTPAGQVYAASARARLAIRAASAEAGLAAAIAALEALPAGYPIKSRWLHWRDLLLAIEQTHRWNEVRRRLSHELQRDGLPPSEARAALLGELDLTRWRAEGLLLAATRTHLEAAVEQAAAAFTQLPPRLVFTASAGRALLILGDETAGATALHRATEELPLYGAPRAARLFSRPSPEAALWLRRAVERAALIDDEAREGLLHQAVLALIALATRHRARHVMREALDPLPVRFRRPDLMAGVLTAGALAWLACGDRWEAHEWLGGGLRLAVRHPRHPLLLEPALNTVRWVEKTRDYGAFELLRDLSQKLVGSSQLILRAALAELLATLQDRDRGWEQLTATYRFAQTQQPDTRAVALAAVAGTLLAWQHDGVAFTLLRRAVSAAEADPGRLPSNLAGLTADREAEETALVAALRDGPWRADAAAAAVRVLLRGGQTELAARALEAAWAAAAEQSPPRAQLRAVLSVARQVAEGVDLDLRSEVEAAVAEEAAQVLERLRIDDPPRSSRYSAGSR